MEALVTILDVETTAVEHNGSRDPSPYLPDNKLVSVGWENREGTTYACFNHNKEPPTEGAREALQSALDRSRLIVGHNIKFDLSWLLECGFVYTGDVWDTMICEFVFACGVMTSLDLSSCCSRYGLPTKDDGAAEYWDKGIGYEAMPWEVVEKYGRQDVSITKDLYLKQYKRLKGE